MRLDIMIENILVSRGFKKRTSQQLLQTWEFFVDQCSDGYDWSIYEFDNELSVRDHIDAVLNDAVIKGIPGFDEFVHKITEIDDRYKNLLQPAAIRPATRDSWWRKGVLKYAGDEYRSDMESRYSIPVEPYR